MFRVVMLRQVGRGAFAGVRGCGRETGVRMGR